MDFSDIQSVRLASGVEMQQRWPMQQEQEIQHQKTNAAPSLIEISPAKGNQGTIVTIVVQNLPRQLVPVKLAFNSLLVDTKQMQAQGITSLVASVPPFESINSTSPSVPISVVIIDQDSVIETWPVAEFCYELDTTSPSTPNASSVNSLSPAAEENFLSGSSTFNTNSFYQANSFSNPSFNSFDYSSPSTPTFDLTDKYYNNVINTAGDFTQMLTSGFETTTPNTYSQVNYARPVTSYYQKTTPPHIPATSVANYQPYPGLVSRTNLKMTGDLDSMAKNWTPEEFQARRRLVQFWREQDGNDIRCSFDAVPQGERVTSGQIVVSCIYWAERNDCFITSVDCIHLLESLMDIRFSVEEKNRVRRNLEGFRPLTVSKCKADSSEFFKVIMGFPNPKPRNIEKDVKVFPWKTLPYALKKIITKYTASSYHRRPQSQLKSSSSQQYPMPSTSSSTSSSTTNAYDTSLYQNSLLL